MSYLIRLTTTIPSLNEAISRSRGQRGFLLVPLALAWLVFSPRAGAVDPPPDGGYPNSNTAEGENALLSLTDGVGNTAIGYHALYSNTIGDSNTATGASALFYNTTGYANTATGALALISNTTGLFNTATGYSALHSNTTGNSNTATGYYALYDNTTGHDNVANGYLALYLNSDGFFNTANGASALYNNVGSDNTANGQAALYSNTSGNNNTANGQSALYFNTTGLNNTANGQAALFLNSTGSNNTAIGISALQNNTTGNSNIALGVSAGANLTIGSNNIAIGNAGVAGDTGKIRIGTKGTQKNAYIAGIYGVTASHGVAVFIDSNGHLGTTTSSARFKDAIKPMDKASEAILALEPVTFRYKHELDPDGIPQFGLVAEQVEKVSPDLVARDDQNKPYTVRYEAVNAMLLNEFLKEHRRVETLEMKMAQQQEKFRSVTSQLRSALKEQAAQIQKVTRLRRVEVSKSVPRVVASNE